MLLRQPSRAKEMKRRFGSPVTGSATEVFVVVGSPAGARATTLDRRRVGSIRTAGTDRAGLRWSRRGLARIESGHDVFDVGLEH
jgi:hypothetical protein